MLNRDPVLKRCGSTGAVVNDRGELAGPWSYSTSERVGESVVSEAPMDVATNFTSGAKVGLLGGRSSSVSLEKPSSILRLFSDGVASDESS
jgi:hypothetical protein